MLSPLKTHDGVLSQQWELGEAGGIDLFTRLPQNIIDSNLAILEEHKHETDERPDGREDGNG